MAAPRLSVVVPGFGGDKYRAGAVDGNLGRLHGMAAAGDVVLASCDIFVYVPETSLSMATLNLLIPTAAPCGCVFRRHKGHWISHVRELNTSETVADLSMLFLDSIAMDATANVRLLADVMSANCLGLVSPACDGCQTKILLRPNATYNTSEHVGRLVQYADAQLYLMTLPVLRCWHGLIDLISLEVDPIGWSMVRLLPDYCRVRTGIVDAMVIHKAYGNYATHSAQSAATYSWRTAAVLADKGYSKMRQLYPDLIRGSFTRIVGPLVRPAPRHLKHEQHAARAHHGHDPDVTVEHWGMPLRCGPTASPFSKNHTPGR